MNINIIPLRSKGRVSLEEQKFNNNFIEEINNNLIDEDFVLVENASEPVMNVVFIESGGSEVEFLKIYEQLNKPILLLTTQRYNSYPACLEIKTFCSLKKIDATIIIGTEEECAESIKIYARAFYTVKQCKGATLGVIGKPSEWLIASIYDNETIYKRFHIRLVDIDMDELFLEIDKKELEKIPHLRKLENRFKNHQALYDSLYIYSAIKRLVNKYELKGLTIRCFDLIDKYKNTACLALALLNEEGVVSACEGDVYSLITMYYLYVLTGRPSFQANPSSIDFNNYCLILAHCTLPLNMANEYKLTTHFESDLGIGIEGNMPLGNVTISKFFLSNNKLCDSSFFATSKIIENTRLSCFCRTQIKVELEPIFCFALDSKNCGNHLILTYNNVASEMGAIANILDIDD